MNKHPFLFSTFLLSIVLIFSSCRYDNGPLLSFKSPETRLVNSWVVVSATDENGNDDTANYDNWTFTFEEDGTAKLIYPILGVNLTLAGEWNLLDDKENLQLLLSDGTGLVTLNEEFYIEKLTTNQLWLEDRDNDERTIRLEPTP